MNAPAPNKHSFFAELKRRHVWRVAIAYAVVGWLVVQVATQVFPAFHMPDWTEQFVVIVVVIGFPIALVLAWAFELTPEGIRRTESADSPEARLAQEHRQVGRKLNTIIVAVLVLAVALLGWRLYAVRHEKATVPIARTAAGSADEVKRNPGTALASSSDSDAGPAASGLRQTPAIPVKSVAVLPFANESGNKDQQFFSDGLSEDLITALSQFAGLRVISRNSAFQFRDSKDSSAEIGKLLGVAHLLEGSVQRAGDEVRITATLVNAADGSVLWTQRYDKPYKDLFALQDAITRSVADALKAKLLSAPGAVVQSERPPSGSLAAWQAYQQGKFYGARASQADIRKALAHYFTATRLDPRYAAAYVHISNDWSNLGSIYLYGAAKQDAYAKARAAADKALTLAPNLASAHLALGSLLSLKFDWIGAQAEYQRAAQLAPKDTHVLVALGSMDARLGHVASAARLVRNALSEDPLHAGWYNVLSSYLGALGRLNEAQQASDKAIELQPAGDTLHAVLSSIAILRGNSKAALTAAGQETDPAWRQIMLAQALQIGTDKKAADAALQALIADQASAAPYQIAETYALRQDPDNMFHWLDRAWIHHDPGLAFLLYDPIILRYRNDPRFAAFCRKVGLPTTTDAVAMKL